MQITTIEETFNGAKIFPVAGRYFRLLATLNAVDVEFGVGNKFFEKLAGVEAGAWAKVAREFTHVRVRTSASETVKFVVTDGEAGYDRLFVAVAQAVTSAAPASALVGPAPEVVLAAGSRKRVIFRSDPANLEPMALYPTVAGVNAAIFLYPGDVWIEDVAPSLEWTANTGETNAALHSITFS